jgi:hypothetical protein
MRARARDLVHERDVQWQVVESSNVHSALFAANQDLYVRFLRSGPDDIYKYEDRSPDEWQEFRTAASKGGWIWDNPIDEGWPYSLLTTRAFADVAREDLPPATRKFLD